MSESYASLDVVPRPAAATLPVILLEIQIRRPQPILAKSET